MVDTAPTTSATLLHSEHDALSGGGDTFDAPAPVPSIWSGIARYCWPAPFKALHPSSPLLVVSPGAGAVEATSSFSSSSLSIMSSSADPPQQTPPVAAIAAAAAAAAAAATTPPPRRPPVVRGASDPVGSSTAGGGRGHRPRMEGRQQGVLWKRRDFFKNRWRPRWFVLQPGQGILTYYLLSGDQISGPETIVSSSPADPHLDQTQPPHQSDPASPGIAIVTSPSSPWLATETSASLHSSSNHHPHPRDRATSWDSRASENTLDYDVVPRGTVYLMGCAVRANPDLTRPAEQLFCFTIDPPTTTEPQIHLAARTSELRDLWVDKIAAVCNGGASSSASPRLLPQSALRGASPTRPSVRTIPEHPSAAPADPRRSPVPETARAGPARRSASENSYLPSGRQSPDASSVPPPRAADSPEWRSQSELRSKFLYSNLSDSLVDRLKDALQQGLDEFARADTESDCWRVLYRQPTAAALRHHRGRRGQPRHRHTIRMDATLPYPLKRVFELLVDGSRLEDVEGRKSVKESRVVHQLNPHTSIDRVRYHGEWPTSSIDFAVVSHWQIFENDGEQAICMANVSCQEADDEARRDRNAPSSRSSISCFTVLRRGPVAGGSRARTESCRMYRRLSVDLGEGVSPQLVNSFLTQRASLPLELSSYVDHFEPTSESRHKSDGALTDELLIRDIIRRLEDTRKRAIERRRKSSADPQRHDSSLVIEDGAFDAVEDDANDEFLLPPLDKQAVLLFAPLVVYGLSLWIHASPPPAFWFALALYCSLRQLVILHLGPEVSPSARNCILSSVTCRFQVDLKGILRFISNKKEEREEMKRGGAEVTIHHIVACAVASAMRKEQSLSVKRVTIPWLCIDRTIRRESEPVSVTFLSDRNNGLKATTLEKMDQTVQRVAEELKNVDANVDIRTVKVGSCLIVAAPNYEDVGMETDVLPSHPNVRVVCTIGGVHGASERGGSSGQPPSPQPSLSLSLTVVNMDPSDFAASRRLAEDVKTMLRFPEMCDD